VRGFDRAKPSAYASYADSGSLSKPTGGRSTGALGRSMLRAAFGVVALVLLACGPGVSSDVSGALTITDRTMVQLRDLRAEPKFRAYAPTFYPGAPNESVRSRCEQQLNLLIDRLIAALSSHPTKGYVLQQFRATLPLFGHEDSEEQDRLLAYLERIMDITGVASSDGLLNEWRYGFDPNEAP
jgi:hypothetical protein